jgi:hypothetical protein
VLAILATMMVPYFSKSFTLSSAPIASLNNSLRLNQVMEKISIQYAQYPHWRPNTVYAAGTIILPPTGATKGYRYSTGGGTSGATEPAQWPLTVGGQIPDSTITWTNAGAAPTLANLQTCLGTEGLDYEDAHPAGACAFGSYHVIDNHFITFDASNVEKPCTAAGTDCIDNAHYLLDYGRYLKVTIGFRSDDAARTGETLTTLFVLR